MACTSLSGQNNYRKIIINGLVVDQANNPRANAIIFIEGDNMSNVIQVGNKYGSNIELTVIGNYRRVDLIIYNKSSVYHTVSDCMNFICKR